MIMELFEKQIILLVTLLQSKKSISGIVLAKKCELSQKTIKKEIDDLNDYLIYSGFQIVSKTGSGYELEINDVEKFTEFKKRALNKFHRNLVFRDSQVDRIHFIIRQLLSNVHNIFIEDIAEDCFCSASMINRDMKKVKERLLRYGLKVENRTNHGLVVQGSEWLLRLALMSEYQIWQSFESGYQKQDDDDFKALFLDAASYQTIYEAVRGILIQTAYPIPYNVLPKITWLIILATTRKEQSSHLMEEQERFCGVTGKQEERIAQEIFEKLKDYPILEIDQTAIAAYIQANRIIPYTQFCQMDYRKEIEDLVMQFIDYFEDYIPIRQLNLETFTKDLCCNFSIHQARWQIGVHTDSQEISNFRRDGLLHLDCCLILYLFFKEKTTLPCTLHDALSFYPIFSYLTKEKSKKNLKQVLVISQYGFFYARNLVLQLNRLSQKEEIEFIPIEYLTLASFNKERVAAIATDIDEIKAEYPQVPVFSVHYFRKPEETKELIREIMMPRRKIELEYFHLEDLIYVEEFHNMAEIYNFIELHILQKSRHAAEFIEQLAKRNQLHKPTRKNQIMVLRTFKDVLGWDFFKIIVLNKPYKLHNDQVSLIILYNVAANELNRMTEVNRFISMLMHNDELILSKNQNKDYDLFLTLMAEE